MTTWCAGCGPSLTRVFSQEIKVSSADVSGTSKMESSSQHKPTQTVVDTRSLSQRWDGTTSQLAELLLNKPATDQSAAQTNRHAISFARNEDGAFERVVAKTLERRVQAPSN